MRLRDYISGGLEFRVLAGFVRYSLEFEVHLAIIKKNKQINKKNKKKEKT